MKKLLLIILFSPLLFSCGVYEMNSQPRITHVLAINSLGEQVNVPINSIILRNDPYFYTNWQFYWGNTWYWGYNWYNHVYDPYWRPRLSRYYVNYRPNLRNYTFHRRNRGNTHRNPSVTTRRNVNNRPVVNRNPDNRVRQRIRVNTTTNRRITPQNRVNRTSRRVRN